MKLFLSLVCLILASAFALEDEVQLDFNASQGEITLFEGNGATQNVVCNLFWENTDKFWNFEDYAGCANDEARSMTIQYAKAGTTLTIFDSPSGSKDDDYTVIKIRKDIVDAEVVISFEESYSTEIYEVIFHENNGLDGKVSRLEVAIF